ncbi:MAG: peptidoglycan DD-metalloendopeptidase family protein [Thermodesulfobacteriota bacterium]|nr:peptidoglycan DD-metalloendopeptidase family protein [Thermodesulfobacteriota bacterium]
MKVVIPPRSLTLTCGVLLVFSLILPLVVSTHCSAKSTRKAEKQRIEQGIQHYRINISKLQQGIAGQQEKIISSEQDKQSLLEQLAQIDFRLLTQLNKRLELEKQMAAQQELIDKDAIELQASVNAKQNVQSHLQKRIRSYYKMGEIGAANVAFSTENLPQILQFRESFANLIAYDKNLIDLYRKSIDELQRAKKALELEKGVLHDFITIAKEEQAATNTIKLEKETLLSQIQAQQGLHKQAVIEMEKAADNLANSLEALKKKNETFDRGFLLDKGKHPAPVHGEILSLFGQKRKNRLGVSSKTTGITIATRGVNKVHAIFEGEIRYASYLYGYGNTVIIDHGFQYFSVISRLEKILTRERKKVEQGDVIGLTGDTATLMEEGIYLEIRHGSKSLNPLEWIDKTGLILP